MSFEHVSGVYLGHQIDGEGLHTPPSKVSAIVDALEPKNVQKLRSFLGFLNYYSRFIFNLASILYRLNRLLQNDITWKWSSACACAFWKATQQSLVSSQVLVHYKPELPIKMTADASVYGVGAVISHTYPDGSELCVTYPV